MSYVQSNSAGASANVASVSCSFTGAVTAGNTVIVAIEVKVLGSPTISSVVDNQTGNTYTAVGAALSNSTASTNLYYCIQVAASGTFTVTATPSASGKLAIAIAEYSSVAAAGFDTTAGTTGATTTPASGATAAVAQNDELFVACVSTAGAVPTITAGTNVAWTKRQSVTGGTTAEVGLEDFTTAAGGTADGTFTLSASTTWWCIVATFKLSTGGPTDPYPAGYLALVRVRLLPHYRL